MLQLQSLEHGGIDGSFIDSQGLIDRRQRADILGQIKISFCQAHPCSMIKIGR